MIAELFSNMPTLVVSITAVEVEHQKVGRYCKAEVFPPRAKRAKQNVVLRPKAHYLLCSTTAFHFKPLYLTFRISEQRDTHTNVLRPRDFTNSSK